MVIKINRLKSAMADENGFVNPDDFGAAATVFNTLGNEEKENLVNALADPEKKAEFLGILKEKNKKKTVEFVRNVKKAQQSEELSRTEAAVTETAPAQEKKPEPKKRVTPKKKENQTAAKSNSEQGTPSVLNPLWDRIHKLGGTKNPRYTQMLQSIAAINNMTTAKEREEAGERFLETFALPQTGQENNNQFPGNQQEPLPKNTDKEIKETILDISQEIEERMQSEQNGNSSVPVQKKKEKDMTEDEKQSAMIKDWSDTFRNLHPGIKEDELKELISKARDFLNDGHDDLSDFKPDYEEPVPEKEQEEKEDPAKDEDQQDDNLNDDQTENENNDENQEKRVSRVNEFGTAQHDPSVATLDNVEKHWQEWCKYDIDENGGLKREFKKLPEKNNTLEFEITPNAAQQALGEKPVTITYFATNDVVMPLNNYEYFVELAKVAKEVDGSNVIECGNIKSPAYFNRLIAAAYANDLDVDNAPKCLDLSKEATQGIPDPALNLLLDKQIFGRGMRNDKNSFHYDDIPYETYQQAFALKKEIAERKNLSLEFDASPSRFPDPTTRNKQIAAAMEAGFTVKNMEGLKLEYEQTKDIPDVTLNQMIEKAVFEPLKKGTETKFEDIKAAMKVKKEIFDRGNAEAGLDNNFMNNQDAEKSIAKAQYIAAALANGFAVENVKGPINTFNGELDHISTDQNDEARKGLVDFKTKLAKENRNNRNNNGNNNSGNENNNNNNNRRNNNYNRNNKRGGYGE